MEAAVWLEEFQDFTWQVVVVDPDLSAHAPGGNDGVETLVVPIHIGDSDKGPPRAPGWLETTVQFEQTPLPSAM